MSVSDLVAVDLGTETESEPVKESRKKSFFSDEKGNLKFVNFICRRPATVFIVMVLLCIVSTMMLGRLTRRDGNPITEDVNEYDIYDPRSIAYDTLRLAKQEVKDVFDAWKEQNSGRLLEDDLPQKDVGDITYWIYEAKTPDGVFHPDAIKSMREAEATILENDSYGEYCRIIYDNANQPLNCQRPLSSMNIFYASEWDSDAAEDILTQLSTPESRTLYNSLSPCVEFGVFCDLLPDTVTDEQKAWVSALSITMNSMISKWDGEGDLNEDVDQVTQVIGHMNELLTKAPYVNFFLDANFSLENPKSMYSRSIVYYGELLEGTSTVEESEDKLKKFVLDNLIERWDEIQDESYDDKVQSYYFMGTLIWDLILQILLLDGVKAFASFVVVFFYLRLMLGSWFLTAVGMFEIFMSLPLAWISFSYIFQIKYFSALNVLCIFIVMAIGADDIFVFMDAYKQSANHAEVLDSLETRMSWVYRRSGSAMLLTSITTCSAFLCTLISPIAGTRSFGIFAAFVILFDYVLVMSLFCTSVVIYHNRFESKNWCCNCSFWRRCEPTSTEIALEKRKNDEPKEVDRISRFFEEKLGPFILNGRNRLFVGVILIAWVVVSCIYTAKLEPTTSSEQFLDDNHPLQIGVNILSNEFGKTQEDLISQVHFVWGLDPIERKGVNQLLDPEFVGVANFDSDFEFNESCQNAILDACMTLQTDPSLEEFILRKDGLRSVDCFVEQLGAMQVDENANCVDVRVGDWKSENDWQVPVEELDATLAEFALKPAVCAEDGKNVRQYYRDTFGWDGTTLKFAGVSVDSSILDPRGVLAEDVVRVHYDKFVEVAKSFDATLEEACGSKTTMTDLDQKFVFMNNQRIYRTSAVSGSMVGVICGFIVLFASTRKFHIALFATSCILCVLLGVIGFVTMLGWTLGTIEAILISILAGFSVDYVIHLAHAYNHAEGDVEKRVLTAYADMGISVFSGMLTSVVASIPLFFCTLTFFAKFGTFLCLTIVLSWIFANFGFMSLLAQFKISMDKKWL